MLRLCYKIRAEGSDLGVTVREAQMIVQREKCATKPAVYFEFDTRKSDSNKAKHGIDFVEAQSLWKSKHVLLGAKDALEKRYVIIGRIGTQNGSAIITYRAG